jgi:hypothetical protein
VWSAVASNADVRWDLLALRSPSCSEQHTRNGEQQQHVLIVNLPPPRATQIRLETGLNNLLTQVFLPPVEQRPQWVDLRSLPSGINVGAVV